jgi:ADP-ribosylglycohydrolase
MSAAQHTSSPSSSGASGVTDKAVGCVLAALCGDALGMCVEGWAPAQIRRAFRGGLTQFQDDRMGLGRYTDDGQMLLALAASLVNQRGRCAAADAARQYALAYDADRGYGPGAGRVRRAQCVRVCVCVCVCWLRLVRAGGVLSMTG